MIFGYFRVFILFSLCFVSKEVVADDLSLVADHRCLFNLEDPSVSPDGNLVAWTARHKFADAYFDPLDLYKPLLSFPYVKGTRIYVGGIEIPSEGSCWSPSFSPDGSIVAYYCDAEGFTNLWLYDLKKNESRRVSSHPIDFVAPNIQKLSWSRDGREIYAFMPPREVLEGHRETSILSFKSKDTARMKSWFRNLDLVAINTETGQWRPVVTGSNANLRSFSLSPSGLWLGFLGHKNAFSLEVHGTLSELAVISSDGKTRYSIMDSVPNGFTSPSVYAWHPFLDYLYLLVDGKVWVAKFSEGGMISCNPIPGEGTFDSSTLAFTKDGKYLIAKDGAKLVLISCDKEEAQVISIPKNWKLDQLVKNSDNILWQPKPNTITFSAKNKEGFTAFIQLDIASGKHDVLLKGRDEVSFFGFNNSHQSLYGLFENYNSPLEINIFDAELNRKVISNIEPKWSSIKAGTVEFFETDVPGTDGMEKVQTAIILPPGAKKGDKLPAIVVQYPGVNATKLVSQFGGGDLLGGIPNWLFTEDHFAVLLPNLVLGEEAIGKPLKTITERLLPQVYEASNLGYIDINHVGIIGQSYGGYGAAGVISHTDVFKAAIAINGIYDLGSFSYYLDPSGENAWITWAELSQGSMGQNLYEDPRRYIENSPFYRADKIHTPLLLIQGKLDDDFTDAGKLFSALRRLERDAEIVIYEKGHHVFKEMRQEDHLDAAKRILDFFHRHLGVEE